MGDLQVTPAVWLLAFLPVFVLLLTLIALKWGAPKAGAAAWFAALTVGAAFFGGDTFVLATASAKGLSLAFFVVSIVWTAVFLYNVVERVDGLRVIGDTMTRLVGDRLLQALLIGWCFSGFLQGIAGFGVPVAVSAPLLTMVGFSPVSATVIALVGHAWAVTFGSMGSSYYTIQLVTGIPGNIIGPWMAVAFALPIIASGFAVAHIEGGFASVRRGVAPVLAAGGVMALSVWVLNVLDAPQIASVVPGLAGCLVLWAIASWNPASRTPKLETDGGAPVNALRPALSFHTAFFPYYLLIGLTVVSQLPSLKELGKSLVWGLDYPALTTGLGFAVKAESLYARIGLVSHPAPLLVGAALASFGIYRASGAWRPRVAREAAKTTFNQCVPTTVGIATMVMMSLVMNDTGMTALLAQGIALSTGALFPILSPYIGVLGCFMTGSNTNSNIMFGSLQMETARGLGVSTVIISAAQSVGGSLGSAIAPAKVLVGATVVGLGGREGEVMARAIPYCLLLVLLVGLQTWLMVYVLFPNLL